MTTTIAMLMAAIPAGLVILAAVFVSKAGPVEASSRRQVLLLEIITLGILIFLSGLQFIPSAIQDQAYWINFMFVPVIEGTVVLILTRLPRLGMLRKREKLLIILLGVAILGIIAYYVMSEPSTLVAVLLGVIFTLGAAWLISIRPSRWIWVLPVLVVPLWAVFNSPLSAHLMELPQVTQVVVSISFLVTPVLSVGVMALFVFTGQEMLFSKKSEPDLKSHRPARIEGFLRLLTALVLLACVVYSILWTSIWDSTSDGMGGLAILGMVGLAAVACGMVMSLAASGWARLTGIAFMLIVGSATLGGLNSGWDTSFVGITEQRASQIAQALDRFHARENHYPDDLAELSPRDLLFVPAPVMFRGEDWCYLGTTDKYALAAFFHEYFGRPVSLKVYSSSGNLDVQSLACHRRLAEMQAKYDWTNVPAEQVPQN